MTTPSLHSRATDRYGGAAMTLHWLIALLIFIQIGLGWYMNEYLPDHSAAQAQIERLHISVGLSLLFLVLVRIAVRLTQPPPPLPLGMQAWERILAHTGHLLFYLLMIILPLTGWAIVSVGRHSISFWGVGSWPHLPGLSFLGAPQNRPLWASLKHVHVYILIWIVLANLALHVAGTVKAQLSGHPVIWRMLPGAKRP